jgi:arylsulfatase A-like enzyme
MILGSSAPDHEFFGTSRLVDYVAMCSNSPRTSTAGRGSRRLALVSAVTLLIGAACAPRGDAKRIVLISIDSLRRDRVDCYGAEEGRTPTLGWLARNGTFFQTCVSTSSWTLPSHMSMLTGLPPAVHGVQTDRIALDPMRPLVQEILREAGFRTAGFVSSPFLDARYGFARGFDTYRNFWGGEQRILDSLAQQAGARSGVDLDTIRRRALRSAHDEETGADVIEASIGWVRKNRAHPFFLFVHLWEPHYDYVPPAPYDRMFLTPGYTPSVSMKEYYYNPQIHAGMAKEELDYVLSQYDGEIAYTDRLIGDLVAALGDLRILDKTLVIVTADHGEEFFEHGRKGHRATLYDESILVPLIVRGPGVSPRAAGATMIVSHTDLAPTLLGVAGLGRHAEMRGFDLNGLLAAEEGASSVQREFAASHLVASSASGGLLCEQFSTRALEWTAIRNCSDSLEVFDLARDPGEARRLAASASPGATLIAAACDSLRDLVVARADSAPKAGADEVVLDDALRERLEALGYLK